jgi:hypothetical protein
MAERSSSGGGIGCLVLIVIVVALAIEGYSSLDSRGWVPHSEDSVITAQESWLVGESKDCFSVPLDWSTASAEHKESGYALSSISCDNGPAHQIEIKFYGLQNQPNVGGVWWRCTRDQTGFTCKQTGTWPKSY